MHAMQTWDPHRFISLQKEGGCPPHHIIITAPAAALFLVFFIFPLDKKTVAPLLELVHTHKQTQATPGEQQDMF